MPRNVDFGRIFRIFFVNNILSSSWQSVKKYHWHAQSLTPVWLLQFPSWTLNLTAMQDTFLLCLLLLSPHRSNTFKQNRKKKGFGMMSWLPNFPWPLQQIWVRSRLCERLTETPSPPIVLADPMWRTCSSWKFNFLLSDYFYPGTGALTLRLAFRFSVLLGWAQRACLGLIRESLSDTRRDPEHELAQNVSPRPLKQQFRNHSAPAHSFIVASFYFFYYLFICLF